MARSDPNTSDDASPHVRVRAELMRTRRLADLIATTLTDRFDLEFDAQVGILDYATLTRPLDVDGLTADPMLAGPYGYTIELSARSEQRHTPIGTVYLGHATPEVRVRNPQLRRTIEPLLEDPENGYPTPRFISASQNRS